MAEFMAEFVIHHIHRGRDDNSSMALQISLNQASATGIDMKSWTAPTIVWPAIMVLSACTLALSHLYSTASKAFDGDHLGGRLQTRIPVFYYIFRLAVRISLLSFTICGYVEDGSSTALETWAIGYTLLLDAFRILAVRISTTRATIMHHVNIIVFFDAVFAFIQLSPVLLYVGPHEQASRWLLLKFAAASLSLLVAFITPREWTPPTLSFELAHREKPGPSPEQTCSYFSYFVSYGWLTDIILKGSKRRLVIADMLPVPEYDEPLIWRARVIEARKRFKTTLLTLAYTLRQNISTMVFFAALTAVVEFIAPLGLYQLLSHIQNPSAATIRPGLWVALLFIGPTLRSISYQQYIFSSTRLVVRTRLCMIQEIYAKAARIFDTDDAGHEQQNLKGGTDAAEQADANGKKEAKPGSKSESITNLMAYDVDAIWSSRDFILVCTASPIEVTIGVVFLYKLFGPSSLIALAVMLLSFPFATLLSRTMSGLQREVMKKTDRRVSLISEYLSSIRTIKYLGWEDIMADNINKVRRDEEMLTWRRNLTAVAVAVLGDSVPLFALFSMFAVDTLVLGHPLTASRAFTALSIIETLRLQFVWIANVTRFISQALVAFGRIDKFMTGEPETVRHPEGPPAFYKALFRRAQHEDSFRLEVDESFVVGGLNVISGASGSGKSTLLLSLLGETILESGSATCPRDVSYSSQVPWLINDTIRANILLHEDFEERRYNMVLDACGLRPDLERFESNDLTSVGDNGSNLSGGQRQRVCLARAVYARSNLLLLDDIFSALDSVTQKHVWEHCFHEDLIQGRTVILVTQMQAAKDAADMVMELAHGQIASTTLGGGNKLGSKARLIPQQRPTQPKLLGDTVTDLDQVTGASHFESIEEKVDQEIRGRGRNSRLLFWHYMVFFGSRGHVVLALVLCLLSQLAFFAIPLWLSVWVGSSREDAESVAFYVAIYGAWLVSFSTIFAMSQAYLQWGARKAAHTLHERLVRAALWVSVHWYDKNPPGRFINRFSSDTYSLDTVLVDYLRIAIDNIFRFLLRLTAIGSIMPVFALPAAFICSIGLVCAEMYTRAQLSVKALTSASQSPIFSFFVESLAGKAVIRSRSGMQEAFADDLARRLRVYARASETQYNLNRWICVRADGCAAIISLFTGIIAISMGSSAPAGRLGFSLTSAIGLGQTILTMVRNMNELEAELNCFQRVREYASLPLEKGSVDDEEEPTSLPDSWPSQGQVEFRRVTAKYAVGGPDILQDLSLTISSGERVAVVGRTGSGKSTLALSLLGFTNITKGQVFVDGVDISTVPLRVLRRRLTIIPQEPILFGSDVRFNLDPAKTAPDEHLAEAIDACSVVESLGSPRNNRENNLVSGEILSGEPRTNPPSKSLSLDTLVAPRGSNFSVGQRQVLCLARATVRRPKVVVLDEATASLDHASDMAVQQVLRSAFRGKTILAIVHRLSTIMDYDRVVVMEGGRVCEVGSPLELYQRKGAFYAMVRQSIEHGKGGEWTEDKLRLVESAGDSII